MCYSLNRHQANANAFTDAQGFGNRHTQGHRLARYPVKLNHHSTEIL
jgi:hypothetical protein